MNMIHSHPVQYEGHIGLHIMSTNRVLFYNLEFSSMIQASNFLKGIKPSPNFMGHRLGSYRYLHDDLTGECFCDGLTFDCKKDVYEYCKIMSRTGKNGIFT